MSDVDLPRAHDAAAWFYDAERYFQSIGFRDQTEIMRFLDPWGEALDLRHPNQRPKAVGFILAPESVAVTRLSAKTVASLFDELAAAQHKGDLLTVGLDATVRARIALSDAIRSQLSAGGWTKPVASRYSRSYAKGKCFAWASGTSFSAFIDGTDALSYTDVRDRSQETAEETFRKCGWGKGEFLERCGTEALTERSARGIWFHHDERVLRRRPEELIQSVLYDFLKTNMSGFRSLEREHHVENEGRVDLKLIKSDNAVILIEVKWVGRSILKEYENTAAEALTKDFKAKWKCDHVLVISPEQAKSGLAQLATYIQRTMAQSGYLVVYDCRYPNEAAGRDFEKTYPKPAELASYQYGVLHIAVDPRPASVRAKYPRPSRRKKP